MTPDSALVARLRAAGCVFAEDEAALLEGEARAASDPVAALEHMVARRVAGDPLEQIVGWAEFCGLRIAVEPGVFVPRQRTALLVNLAAEWLSARDAAIPDASPLTMLDLCCGSGAIGTAVAARFAPATPAEPAAAPTLTVWAADLEPAAVHCARRNLPDPALVLRGDLFDALPATLRGTFDLIVVNAPYVPTDDIALMPPEARLFEPNSALDGGVDGLGIQRRVTAEAAGWLVDGGVLLIETSETQAPETRRAFVAGGFEARIVHDDELYATVVVGTKRPPQALPKI